MKPHQNDRTRGKPTQRGSIMVLTLVVLFIVAGFVLAMVTVSSTGERMATINSKKVTARSLAEGAVELAKQWAQTEWANQGSAAVQAKAVSSLDQLSDKTKWSSLAIGGYQATYAMVRVPPVLTPTPTAASKVNYSADGYGWYVDGLDGVRTYHYLLAFYGHAEYTPKQTEGDSRTVMATTSRVVELQVTPLFQYAVFYNPDLEIQPGPNMTLTGRVHSNKDMFLSCGSGNTLKLDTDYVHAVGKIYDKRKDDGTANVGNILIKNLANLGDASTANDFQYTLPNGTVASSLMLNQAQMSAMGINTSSGFDSTFGGYDYNANGNLNDNKDWKPWGTQAMSMWGGTVQSSDMGVEKAEPPQQNLSLDMFAAKSGGDYIMTSPGVYVPVAPGTGDYVKGYFYSKAGLIIKDGAAYAPDGTNITSALIAGTLTTVNTYDAREGKTVPNTKIDVTKLKQSLAQAGSTGNLGLLKNNWNGLIYGTNTTATSSAPKGILLANGTELPDNPITGAKTGMTLATNLPAYVQGDYNTKVNGTSSPTNDPNYHKPAAVIADAVNLLSNAWNNSKTSASGLPTASATVFNTAMLSGITSTTGSQYSGGLENMPRFHEGWSGVNCTISGSFVNLWPSKIAKAPWVYGGNKYTAPNRLWDFDPNYKDYAKLPPFTPLMVITNEIIAQQ
jgi:hypothetical protein